MKFNQEEWLKPYNDMNMNTDLRKQIKKMFSEKIFSS